MKAMHDVLGEVEIIDASEGLTVLIEHDGQTKEVLRRSVTPLPAAELRRREQAHVMTPEEEEATLSDVQIIQRRDAEIERLQGLLAQITAIAEDSLDMARDRHTEVSYARRLAAIKAAREATNAQK